MNSYEDFLLAIEELYSQNKLDFNNYKLLKKEDEIIRNYNYEMRKPISLKGIEYFEDKEV